MAKENEALLNDKSTKYASLDDRSTRLSGVGRAASISVLGGSTSLGRFFHKETPQVRGLPKSLSFTTDGSPSYLSPSEAGRQGLYQGVPFTALLGMQRTERSMVKAFADFAAELDVHDRKELNEQERSVRKTHASRIIQDEMDFEKSVVTVPLVIAIVIAAACQFLVGYGTGVMNAPVNVVFPDHSTFSWSLAVSAFAIGGPFGAVIGGRMADARGRRGALLIDMWLFLIGGVLQTCALNMIMIIVARFVIGVASGYSSVLVPIYLGEMAPPTLRGMLGTVTQLALCIGILAANLLAFPFATLTGWRVLFAITPLVAICQLLAAPFLLESPRWLLGRDPDSLKARYIIKRLRGLRSDKEVENEVGNFVLGGAAQRQEETSQFAVLAEMWRQPNIRMLLISALALQVFQEFAGINAVFYYSTSFFEGVIDNPLIGTTLVGAVNVLATYAVLFLMDRCGRKTLILWSSGGMFISCIAITLSLLGILNKMMALVAVNTYVCFYEFGLGPIPWLIVAEMFDGKYVAASMSVASQLNWVCNFIIGFIFPFMNQILKAYTFVPFGIVLLSAFLFAAFVLPETQGTSPEELAKERTKSLSQLLDYEASDGPANKLDEDWRKAMEHLQREEEMERTQGKHDYGYQSTKNNDRHNGVGATDV